MALSQERPINNAPGQVKESPSLVDLRPNLAEQKSVPPEVKTWLQKVEELSDPTQSVINDQGQAILSPSVSPTAKVTVPLTRTGFLSGFKQTISSAGFWLSTFILRLIKMKKGNVVFKSDQ